MKTSNKLVDLVLLSACFFFTNCTPKEESLSSPQEILTHGSWTVDYYFNGFNHTNNFHEYLFSFSSGGQLNCSNATNEYTGDWTVVRNTQNELLSIEISAAQSDLQELNDKWTIAAYDAYSVSLQKGTEQLRLRKR